jgi:hypothetical protein
VAFASVDRLPQAARTACRVLVLGNADVAEAPLAALREPALEVPDDDDVGRQVDAHGQRRRSDQDARVAEAKRLLDGAALTGGKVGVVEADSRGECPAQDLDVLGRLELVEKRRRLWREAGCRQIALQALGRRLRLDDAGAKDKHLVVLGDKLGHQLGQGVVGLDVPPDQLPLLVVGQEEPTREKC